MKNKILNAFLGSILIYLLVAFVSSSIISQTNKERDTVISDDIVEYAKSFLSNDYLIEKGILLDCSGFTKSVFARFNCKLPASAIQQYNLFRIGDKTTKPGDLLFFSMGHKQINHVGLIINDSIFIHSPGKNKPVRTDYINSVYWLKHYKGNGRVIKKD